MRYWIHTVPRSRNIDGITSAAESRLRRLEKGDAVVFYSPRADQKFTAIGEVLDEKPFQAGEDDPRPWRRQVKFLDCGEAAVQPLIGHLDFIRNKKTWGVAFRRGFFEIGEGDYRKIAAAMQQAI